MALSKRSGYATPSSSPSVDIDDKDLAYLSLAKSLCDHYAPNAKGNNKADMWESVYIDDPRLKICEIDGKPVSIGAWFGPAPRPVRIMLSKASMGGAPSGGGWSQAMNNFKGPDNEMGDNQWCDFNTVLEAYRSDNNTTLTLTLYNVASSIGGGVMTLLFPWTSTDALVSKTKIYMSQPVIAMPSGPQTTTPGISVAEKTMSNALQEFQQDFDMEGQYLLTEGGVREWIAKSRSLVDAFIIRVNRNAIIELCNHEDIGRFFQNMFINSAAADLALVWQNNAINAFPVQKGGTIGLAGTMAIMRDTMRKNDLRLTLGAAVPNALVCAEGVKMTLATIRVETEYTLTGPNYRENITQADDAKDVVLEGIRILEHRSDNVNDTTMPNKFVGTLFTHKGLGGWCSMSSLDFQGDLSKYRSAEVYGALPNLNTGKDFVVTLSDAVNHAIIFDKRGNLREEVLGMKKHLNAGGVMSKNSKAFKDNVFMMFRNSDTSQNGNDSYETTVYTGELVRIEDMAKMVETILNHKGFKALLPKLMKARAFSRSLSNQFGNMMSPAQLAIVAGALHSTPGGVNQFGGLNFPTIIESPANAGRYIVSFNGDFVQADGSLGVVGTALDFSQDEINPMGWGTVGGIFTLASLGARPVGAQRSFLSDSVVNSAIEVADTLREFTDIFEKVFPGHPTLNEDIIKIITPWIETTKSEYTKIASVSQNFVLGPMAPFFFSVGGVNLRPVAPPTPTYVAMRGRFVGVAPKALSDESNYAAFLQGFKNTTAYTVFVPRRNGAIPRNVAVDAAFSAFVAAVEAVPANAGDGENMMLRLLDHKFYDSFQGQTQQEWLDRYAASKTGAVNLSPRRDVEQNVWGVPPATATQTRLYFSPSAYLAQTDPNLRTRFIPANPITGRPYTTAIRDDDLEFVALEALTFFEGGARSATNAPGAHDPARSGHSPSYISKRLQKRVKDGIKHSRLDNPIRKGLFVAVATSLCCKKDTWLAWDLCNVYFPALFKIVRPSRMHEVSTAALVDTRGFGETQYMPRLSNVKLGRAETQRWMKVSAKLTTASVVKDPSKCVRHDLFFVHRYIQGEDNTWFDDEHPFEPKSVEQHRSNMCFMGHLHTEIINYGPLKQYYERQSFARENSQGPVYKVDFERPTGPNALYYANVHNFDHMTVARAPDPHVAFNKDDVEIEQMGSGRMPFKRFNHATQQYDRIDPSMVTDVFGPACRSIAGRNGKIFDIPGIHAAVTHA